MAKSVTHCPAKCSGGGMASQLNVDASLLAAAGVEGEWTAQAIQCGYCGLIYTSDLFGQKVRRGYFDGNELMRAENWRPYNA